MHTKFQPTSKLPIGFKVPVIFSVDLFLLLLSDFKIVDNTVILFNSSYYSNLSLG